MKNRYNFAKICYKEYVILIPKNRKLYTYDEDNKLYNFKYINKLKFYQIILILLIIKYIYHYLFILNICQKKIIKEKQKKK
jgi:hypothetical protein